MTEDVGQRHIRGSPLYSAPELLALFGCEQPFGMGQNRGPVDVQDPGEQSLGFGVRAVGNLRQLCEGPLQCLACC